MDALEVLEELAWAQARSSKEILLEGETPRKTIELATNAMGYVSGMVELFLTQDPRPLPCRKGCCYCCYLPVEVLAPEALAIAQYVREKFSPEERERLDRAIDDHIKATEGMDQDRRAGCRTIPCPLLKDGACTVYEVRPMSCRGYHSFDVEQCRRDREQPSLVNTVPTNGMAYLGAGNIAGGLAVALRSQKLDWRRLDLPRALKIALDDPDLLATWRDRPRAFDAAARKAVHPGTEWQEAMKAKLDNRAYRHLTNRPQWSEIEPVRSEQDSIEKP
jgi:hypothetical protein